MGDDSVRSFTTFILTALYPGRGPVLIVACTGRAVQVRGKVRVNALVKICQRLQYHHGATVCVVARNEAQTWLQAIVMV